MHQHHVTFLKTPGFNASQATGLQNLVSWARKLLDFDFQNLKPWYCQQKVPVVLHNAFERPVSIQYWDLLMSQSTCFTAVSNTVLPKSFDCLFLKDPSHCSHKRHLKGNA